MRTTSYAASAASARAACWRRLPMARPNSGPLTACPRALSQRVSGRSRSSRPGGAGRQRGEDGPAGLEVGDRLGRDRHRHVLDVVAELLEQAGRVLPGGHAGGVDVDVRDHGRDEAGDPQPARLPVAGVEERRGRRRRPERVADAAPGQDVEQGRGVADGAGEGAGGREPDRVAVPRGAADPTARRLEADEAAAGGGDPDRAAAVRARARRAAARRRPPRPRRRTSRPRCGWCPTA